MDNITDLEAIQDAAVDLVYYPVGDYLHPVFKTPYILRNADGSFTSLDILNNQDDYVKARTIEAKKIESETSAIGVIYHINKAYRLQFLEIIQDYLSNVDLAELLAYIWVDSEGTSQDPNCSLSQLIEWFTEADKKALMDDEDYQVFDTLPSEFSVYRGISTHGNTNGLSWTLNRETAEWFAKRFSFDGSKGTVIEATAKKEDVLAYFNDRNEQEIVINPKKLVNVKKL